MTFLLSHENGCCRWRGHSRPLATALSLGTALSLSNCPIPFHNPLLFVIPSVPGFPTSQLSPVPFMWFSSKRTTCSFSKPQLSTGNPGKPRDLQCAIRAPQIYRSTTFSLCHPACPGEPWERSAWQIYRKQRALSAQSKDPGDACWQMLLGVFRRKLHRKKKSHKLQAERNAVAIVE